MLRRFTLQNRVNQLGVCVLTSGGTVSSIKLDDGKQEAVVNYNNTGKRPDAGDGANNAPVFVPPPQLPLVEWQSHVLVGLHSLMLTTTPAQQLLYQLTTDNELMITGKLKGQLTAMAPFYFNLISTSSPTSIDGHFLHIKSSETIPDLPISMSTEIPFSLTGPVPSKLIFPENDGFPPNGQYEVIMGCIAPPTSGEAAVALVATLSYENRTVEVHLQSNSATPNQPVKMRVRIRRDGISLMPTAMNEFKCIYKLSW
jgi:hypothetical protein